MKNINYLCDQIPEMVERGFIQEAQSLVNRLHNILKQQRLFFEDSSGSTDITHIFEGITEEALPTLKVRLIKKFRGVTGASLYDAKRFVESDEVLQFVVNNNKNNY